MHASMGHRSSVNADIDFYIVARKGLSHVLQEIELDKYRNFCPCSGFDEVLRVSMGSDADRGGTQSSGADVGIPYVGDTDNGIGDGLN
jgi:hypothetical protein